MSRRTDPFPAASTAGSSIGVTFPYQCSTTRSRRTTRMSARVSACGGARLPEAIAARICRSVNEATSFAPQ